MAVGKNNRWPRSSPGRATLPTPVMQPTWSTAGGAVYAVQSMLCSVCCAIRVGRSVWCNLRGASCFI
eukprot:4808601-Pyramimonas_sp.AAC.1